MMGYSNMEFSVCVLNWGSPRTKLRVTCENVGFAIELQAEWEKIDLEVSFGV